MRAGQTKLYNVEIFNCSQIDTEKSALRFEGASSERVSEVVNASIYNGLGWGIYVKNSAHIYLKGNQVFNFRSVGVAFEGVRNVTFDGNVVSLILERDTIEVGVRKTIDRTGAVCACSLEAKIACKDLFIKNNIVAGAVGVGYVALGSNCGEKSEKFYNNIAHSVGGFNGLGGIGAKIVPD